MNHVDKLSLFVAVAVFLSATDAQQGTLYDMQGGLPSTIETPCIAERRAGKWFEDAAGNHQLTEGGKVVVSEKNRDTCMRTPAAAVQRDYKFAIRIFVSSQGFNPGRKDILVVRFVEEGNSLAVHEVEIDQNLFVIGWQTRTFDLPISLNFESKRYSVEIWSVNTGQAYTAIRWFSIVGGEEPTTTTAATTPEVSASTAWTDSPTESETIAGETTVEVTETTWTSPETTTVAATQPTVILSTATTDSPATSEDPGVTEETSEAPTELPTTLTTRSPLTSTTPEVTTTRRVGCRSNWRH